MNKYILKLSQRNILYIKFSLTSIGIVQLNLLKDTNKDNLNKNIV